MFQLRKEGKLSVVEGAGCRESRWTREIDTLADSLREMEFFLKTKWIDQVHDE